MTLAFKKPRKRKKTYTNITQNEKYGMYKT